MNTFPKKDKRIKIYCWELVITLLACFLGGMLIGLIIKIGGRI